MDIGQGTLIVNPFLLDLFNWTGIFVMFMLSALSTFLFFRKSFFSSGILAWLIGLLLMYNGISWLIAGIPFFIGFMLIFGGFKK